MKNLGLNFLELITAIFVGLSVIWMMVEFLMYLEKDTSFNWWSSIIYLICLIVFFVIGRLKKKKNSK